jgi:Zn-dependent M32 family carboxypeptidase
MSYADLVEHHQHLHRLRHLEALASWDEFTMMPAGGANARSDALSTLRGRALTLSWSQGSLLGTEALVEYATGEALSTVAFEQHLQRRYLQREL